MQERFLHFIWKFRMIHPNLISEKNELIEVLYPGDHNTHAGPDFLNGRIRIGTTLWIGNIEIHFKASDWFRHKHQYDEKYKNLILHLVYENDLEPEAIMPEFPATVELKGQFDERPWEVYQSMIRSLNFIPCEKLVNTLDGKAWIGVYERLAIEKLQAKSEQIIQIAKNEK